MAVEIVMPKLSDTMEEGRILKWLKEEGDFVRKGEVVAEVETDKADMDLEVFSAGVISEIRYKEGDTVAVGTVIAVLGSDSKKDEPKKSPKPSKKKEGDANEQLDGSEEQSFLLHPFVNQGAIRGEYRVFMEYDGPDTEQ